MRLIWVVLGVIMATTDPQVPQTFVRVSAWIALFVPGVQRTFWALFSLSREAAATGALIGTFLGPCGSTWQLWVTYVKQWSAFFPVRLYPFAIALDAVEWNAMIAFGFILFAE